MTRFVLILFVSLISGSADDSRSSPQPVRFDGIVQNLTPLSSFSGKVVPVDTDPRYALTMRLESVTGATNFTAGQIVTFAIHSASKLFSGEPTNGKKYEMELDRKVDQGKTTFSGLRLRAANEARQPTPGERRGCILASLARRGCAER